MYFASAIYLHRPVPTGPVSVEAGRYVGVTGQEPEERLKEHLAEAKLSKDNTHKLNWLRSLVQPPVVEVLEHCFPWNREEREKYWIALFRDYGHKLVNGTDGGDGFSPGHETSVEVRKKISKTLMGHRRSEESCKKQAQTASGEGNHFWGKQHSEEALDKMRRNKLGKKASKQTRQKMSASRLGKAHSEAAIIMMTGWKKEGASSQFYGVYWDKTRKKWVAKARHNKKDIMLGRFNIEEDAARAVDAFIRVNNLPTKLLNFL